MVDRERLEEIRFFLKKNKTEFSKVLGYTTPQSYTSYLNGNNNLSMKMVKSLKKYDSRISIDWILEGQGQMLISQGNNNSQNITNDNNGTIGQITNNDNSTKTNSPIELELLRKEVEHLKKSLKDKEDMLEAKEEIIQLLKK